jgi:hypothetical protein
MAKGPVGPIGAICNLNSIFFMLYEIYINNKVPHYIEIIGFLLGNLGGLIVVMPK